jgi:hypothetical protein
MRRSRIALAVLLTLVGLVWLGQGTGLIGGSAMSGSSFWALVGAVLLAIAAVLVVLEMRRPARG